MAVYSKSTKQTEKLPAPPSGKHEMTCVWEGVSKHSPDYHSFLWKNDKYQVFHNCRTDHVAELAADCGVEGDENGDIDTSHFRKIVARVFVENKYAKNGVLYPNCVGFEGLQSKGAAATTTHYDAMKAAQVPDVSEDFDIPF